MRQAAARVSSTSTSGRCCPGAGCFGAVAPGCFGLASGQDRIGAAAAGVAGLRIAERRDLLRSRAPPDDHRRRLMRKNPSSPRPGPTFGPRTEDRFDDAGRSRGPRRHHDQRRNGRAFRRRRLNVRQDGVHHLHDDRHHRWSCAHTRRTVTPAILVRSRRGPIHAVGRRWALPVVARRSVG